MITRLVKGLVLGLILGGLCALALVKGVGMNPNFGFAGGTLVAYTSALITGAVVGLVAGKPIWAEGAWIEALLKTFFGALLAAGGMFLLQKFATFTLDLTAYGAGVGMPGNLVFVALPTLATVLSVFFELDNNDAGTKADKTADKKGAPHVAAAKASPRLRAPAPSEAEASLDDDEPAASRHAKK